LNITFELEKSIIRAPTLSLNIEIYLNLSRIRLDSAAHRLSESSVLFEIFESRIGK
jgi:hypothetical protein